MSSYQSACVPRSKRTLGHSQESRHSGKRPKQTLQNEIYQYEALEQGDIRVLVLYPLENFGELCGHLETVGLHDAPEYIAISYAWGEPVFDHTIRLPGGNLRITASLAGALRRFRELNRPVRLWADAICIDQCSTIERNQQVANMAEIYRTALGVYIWLGEADTKDVERFRFYNSFAAIQEKRNEAIGRDTGAEAVVEYRDRPYNNPVIPARGTPLLCQCCNALFKFGTTSLREAAILALGLWKKPWFHRLWVVQEAVLATKATIFCGPHQLSMATFLSAGDSLQKYFTVQDSDEYDDVFWSNLVLIVDPKPWMVRNGASRILKLLVMNRHRSCTDPRDRIYAMLGLCGEVSTPLPLPDYCIEVCDLWTNLSSMLLTVADHWSCDSEIPDDPHPTFALVLAGLQRHDEQLLPSWAADFGRLDLVSDDIGRKYDLYHVQTFGYHAGGAFRPECLPSRVGPDGLRCKTAVLASLDAILQDSSFPDSYPLRVEDWDVWFTTTGTPWIKRCRSFLQTNIFGNLRDEVRYVLELLFARKGLMGALGSTGAVAELTAGAYNSYEDGRDLPLYREIFRQIDHYEPIFLYHKYNPQARLAMASSGHPCWIPPKAAVGDRICLIPGSPYVFLVRPCDDGQYKLVGDVYVHGIMNGKSAPKDEDLQDIVLV